MLFKRRNTLLLRKIITGALIVIFLYLIAIFSYQYQRYSDLRERIEKAHTGLQRESSPLELLYKNCKKTYFLFQSYTVNLNKERYKAYVKQLNVLSDAIEAFSIQQLANYALWSKSATQEEMNMLHVERRNLSQTVRALLERAQAYTILKENPVDIQINKDLLQQLKICMENIRERELFHIQRTEIRGFAAHKINVEKFTIQLSIALFILLIILLIILFYQSALTKHENQLLQDKERAAQLAEEKTSVLANISHEVRTPISALLSIIELLKKNANEHRGISAEYLTFARREIALLRGYVNDILSFNNLEIGHAQIENAFFSLHEVICSTLSLHNYAAHKKGLIVQSDMNFDQGIDIFSNVFRIKHIISNLLANAIKYTERGEVHLVATINEDQGSTSLLIQVSDTGIGIATEDQAYIFRQYYMTDAQNKSRGFGLGLYLSRLWAQQLQGDITVISEPGKGSTFFLRVPISQIRIIRELDHGDAQNNLSTSS